MRYLILTDMHGNWEAMRTVLRKVRRKRFGSTLVLGDLVGYGASPNQIVDSMRGLPGKLWIVRGNHDKVAADLDDGQSFNEAALVAARWTTDKLTKRNLSYMRSLPVGPVVVHRNDEGGPAVAICHGSPMDEDIYLFSEQDAWGAFQADPRAHVTFFGHTHVPSLFILHRGGVRGVLLRGNGELQLHPRMRYLINPGSIGQPRDRNPEAAYMVYDSDTRVVRWYRVPYPIAEAQKRIRAANLPESLAQRLADGV